jgi:hypothetical protein
MKASSAVRITEPNTSRRFVSKEECELESGKDTDYRNANWLGRVGERRKLTSSMWPTSTTWRRMGSVEYVLDLCIRGNGVLHAKDQMNGTFISVWINFSLCNKYCVNLQFNNFKILMKRVNLLLLNITRRASGNPSDSYSGSGRFESQSGRRISWVLRGFPQSFRTNPKAVL